MRTKVGMLVTLSIAAAGLLVGAGASADGASHLATADTPTETTVSTTPDRTMQLDEPGHAAVPAERAGEQIQLTEPPVAPTTTTTTTTTLPPLDQLPSNSGQGRRVVYSKSNQWVWLVTADEVVVKKHPVSGNRQWNLPPPDTYSVSSRDYATCNITNPSICWRYMVRFARGPEATWRDNIGFHEIPIDRRTGDWLQGEGQLGQALSAGCIRQAPADAKALWDFAPIGTKVVVLP